MRIGKVERPMRVLDKPREHQTPYEKKKKDLKVVPFKRSVKINEEISGPLFVVRSEQVQLELDRINADIRAAVDKNDYRLARDLSMELMKMKGRLL